MQKSLLGSSDQSSQCGTATTISSVLWQCAEALHTALQSKMAPGAVCKETAHNTAVQDGARGRVQRLPSLALPSGALCSRYWVDQKVCSIQEYLFNNSFPGGSKGKAPACNAGDPGSIPGLGSSPGKGNGSPWGRKELDTTERAHFTSTVLVKMKNMSFKNPNELFG